MIKDIFTYSISVFGIKAPWFSWCTSVVLPVWSLYVIIFAQRKILVSRKKTCDLISSEIDKLKSVFPVRGNRGLDSSVIDKLTHVFKGTLFNNTWNHYRRTLIYRNCPDDETKIEVWKTIGADEVFHLSDFYGKDLNRNFLNSFPGIITGIGLLMTFVAILVGLLDVSIVDNKVQGLENLIGGLSGKFISSVAALLFSTIFLIYDKSYFSKVFNTIRHDLIVSINSIVPLKSEANILEDIYLNISEQTNTFRTFNTDLSKTLQSSFKENTGPTLDRMVTAIENLNTLADSSKNELLEAIREMNKILHKSEQSRQESMTGQIEILLKDLKESLSSSIDTMSIEFTKSLSGTTQDQFSNIAETVGRMGSVLESTGAQFAESQMAIKELIDHAKNSTENQIVNSSGLIDKMVRVIGAALANMEKKMSALSEKMTNTIEDTADKSAKTAASVIDEVKVLNTESAEKLLKILQKHEEQVDRIENLKQVLIDAVDSFGEYVTGYNEINRDLKNVTNAANMSLNLISSSSQKLKDVQDSFGKVAELTMNKIQGLADSNEQQHELWKYIHLSMEHYKKTFESVESSAEEILSAISSKFQDFSRATQDHFNKTVTIADDHVKNAVGMLSTSIEELRNGLEDLSDVVTEMVNIKNNIRK